jgi:hypothetical protein
VRGIDNKPTLVGRNCMSMNVADPSRRAVVSLLSGSVLSIPLARYGLAAAATANAPLLATPEQIEAETMLLGLLTDPELKALQASLKTELAATPRGQMSDGAARLDEALAQWTNSLIFGELMKYRRSPAFLWATDDTPRTWLGHTLGGVGTSGDNPDAIYRSAMIDGRGRYEIVGQIDMARRPAQLTIEADQADLTQPGTMLGPKRLDVVSAAQTTDRDMVIAADGRFRITVGGPGEGPNHFATPPAGVTIGLRDILSDWNQRPCRLRLQRLDESGPESFDPAEIRGHVLADLPGYVRFWSAFPNIWMGGLKPNTIAQPMKRNGGWGFVCGLRFQLAPGDAVLVTTTRGDARYTGFQINDPWMIAPDARRYQVSLNNSQAVASPDGSVSYVISPTDPGAANWLDTAGIRDGLAILRWQGISAQMTNEGLIREFRVVPLSAIAGMPGLPRVTPEQRRRQLAARVEGYNNRVR